jgi:hypothetical protein
MSARYCIIGAGSSGLAVAKNFLHAGIPFDCIEREDDVGGNWYYGKPASSVYRSTHLISSKQLTEYTDFPMPHDFPEYPSQRQAWEYLRSYARHFGLYERIEFGRSVQQIKKIAHRNAWQVTLDGGEARDYAGIVIANGHNWDPKWPEYPGKFSGLVLHSAQYKTPDVLQSKRVLVVGAGNSGCDIAVESAQNAAATWHSVRRGYHYLPKFVRGRPIDQLGERLLRWRMPLWLRRTISSYAAKIAVGRPHDFGLPKPDHKLFETHPIINSQMLYYVGHGTIRPKPDVSELCGDRVKFVDGSEESIDVIVYATGFRITFPFVDPSYLNWHDGRPNLFLHVFHPSDDTLFVAGLIQPDSGQWGLVDYQAQLITRFLDAQQTNSKQADRFRRLKSRAQLNLGNGIRYITSTRHLLEVEHFSYRERLRNLIRQFD